jgi:hypothetical protein
MQNKEISNIVNKMFTAIDGLIPVYMEVPVDKSISLGNLAVCIID